jgi:hypothetical protein
MRMRVHRWVASIGLLTVIVACKSSASEDDSSDATREQASEQPPGNLAPFKLDYMIQGGIFSHGIPEQLANAYPELHLGGTSKWLRIRTSVAADATTVEGGHAMLIYTGEPVEEFGSGDPIGLFYESLDNDELRNVSLSVQHSPWWLKPPLSGRGHHDGLYRIRYTSSSFSIYRELNPMRGLFFQSVYRLAEALEQRIMNMPKHATLAVQVRVEHNGNEPKHRLLWVSLVNEGVKPIVLTDPRIPREQPPKDESSLERFVPRFEWRIGKMARMNPSSGPHDWTSLPVASLPADAPQSLVLKAGESFELSAPWIAPEPGHYMLRAHWDDFDGPVTPVEGQLPFMPLADDGQVELGVGPYPIHGHAYIEFVFEVSAEANAE